MNTAIWQLGKIQRKLLPWHIFNEFFRNWTLWDPESTFDVEKYPAPEKVKIIPAGRFHNDAILQRGINEKPWLGESWRSCYYSAIMLDEKTFQQLYNVRRNDMISLCKQHELMQKLMLTHTTRMIPSSKS